VCRFCYSVDAAAGVLQGAMTTDPVAAPTKVVVIASKVALHGGNLTHRPAIGYLAS
jgi:hypothetical protein